MELDQPFWADGRPKYSNAPVIFIYNTQPKIITMLLLPQKTYLTTINYINWTDRTMALYREIHKQIELTSQKQI